MALSYHDYTGPFEELVFQVPFPYLHRDHVGVAIIESTGTTIVPYEWVTKSQVRLRTPVPLGARVRVFRKTPAANALVNFVHGAILAETLNRSKLQLLYVAQETNDALELARNENLMVGEQPRYNLEAVDVLATIQGQVTASTLALSLSSRIDKIDTAGTGLLDRMTTAESEIVRVEGVANQTTTGLSSRVSSLESGLTSEQQTRLDGDSQLSTRIDAAVSRITNNEAAIATEQTTRADADSALSVRVDTVQATANARNTIFRQDLAPTANAVGDLWYKTNEGNKPYRWDGTAWVVTDDTRIEANTARIATEEVARADGDSALSTRIDTVQTEVDGNKATIQTQQTSIDGLKAQYTVKIDVNGNVAGFGLASEPNEAGQQTSAFVVRADKFAIINPNVGGETKVPFVVEGGVVYMDNVVIKDHSLGGTKVILGTTNLVPNPNFATGTMAGHKAFNNPSAFSVIAAASDTNVPAGSPTQNILKMAAGTAATSFQTHEGSIVTAAGGIPCFPGEKYHIQFSYARSAASLVNESVEITARGWKKDGTAAFVLLGTVTPSNSAWKTEKYELAIPADWVKFHLYVEKHAGTEAGWVAYWSNCTIIRKMDADTIVAGIVTADHIQGKRLTGATIETSPVQDGNGAPQARVAMDEATDSLQVWGDRGDGTIELLGSLGIEVGDDTIALFGTNDSSKVALRLRGRHPMVAENAADRSLANARFAPVTDATNGTVRTDIVKPATAPGAGALFVSGDGKPWWNPKGGANDWQRVSQEVPYRNKVLTAPQRTFLLRSGDTHVYSLIDTYVAIAQGFDRGGAVNHVYRFGDYGGSSFEKWEMSQFSQGFINYLYVERDAATGAYSYGSTITPPQMSRGDPLRNKDLVKFHPDQTSDTSETGYVSSASSVYSTTYQAWRAFSGENIDGNSWVTPAGTHTGWVQLQLPGKAKLTAFSVTTRNDPNRGDPKTFSLLGSNDGASFTTLENYSTAAWGANETRYFTVPGAAAAYKYYRLNIATISLVGLGNYVTVGEFQLFAKQHHYVERRGYQLDAAPSNGMGLESTASSTPAYLTYVGEVYVGAGGVGGTLSDPTSYLAGGDIGNLGTRPVAAGRDETLQREGDEYFCVPLPGGLMMQGGLIKLHDFGSGAELNYTLPNKFPTRILSVTATIMGFNPNGFVGIFEDDRDPNPSVIRFRRYEYTSTNQDGHIYWMAIGY